MGLFERMGRNFEQFKQTAQEAARESRSEPCPNCDASVPPDATECPECGEPLESADEDEE